MSITIAGNYYGYGSVESAKKSHYKDQYENYSDKDLSSAIVINGKATKLDMSRRTKAYAGRKKLYFSK